MNARWSIDVDTSRDLVHMALGGFFTAADMPAFYRAREAGFGQLTCAPYQHVTLVDITDMKIQSQDMVEAFRKVLSDPRYMSRRMAFVVKSSLARQQLLRAMDRRNAMLFTTVTEAEAWLFNGEHIERAA